MYSKQHELEAIIEDLIENTIIEALVNNFSTQSECESALMVLQEKLDELDPSIFKSMLE
jgi:SOS response regulatory protein OraA/RecX